MRRDYVFDLVLHQITLNDKSIDKSLLAVTANFRGEDFEITSSRIDVTDFKEGRSIEFKADNVELQTELVEKPLRFGIRNGEGNPIGEFYLAKMAFPDLLKIAHDQVTWFLKYRKNT